MSWNNKEEIETTCTLTTMKIDLIYCPKEESCCYTTFVFTVQFCQFLQTLEMSFLLLMLQSCLLILEFS